MGTGYKNIKIVYYLNKVFQAFIQVQGTTVDVFFFFFYCCWSPIWSYTSFCIFGILAMSLQIGLLVLGHICIINFVLFFFDNPLRSFFIIYNFFFLYFSMQASEHRQQGGNNNKKLIITQKKNTIPATQPVSVFPFFSEPFSLGFFV